MAIAVMRDHKTTLFEGREEEMNAELAEKEAQNARLEVSPIHALHDLRVGDLIVFPGAIDSRQHLRGSSASC